MRWVVLLSAVILAAPSAAADTYPRQPGVDAIHYRVAITVQHASAHIEAESAATFRIVSPVPAIELDLIGGAGAGMTVHAVTLGDEAVAFSHREDRLRLTVPPHAKAGDEITYEIRYSGTPANGLQVFTNMHGERVLFSEGWPNRARHWVPMIDHPYDKATGEIIVTAPSHWQVVSNGVLVEEVDLDAQQRRTHWKQSVPLPSWLFAVGIARFAAHHAGSVRGVPLQTWSFPQDRTAARALFEDTSRRAMEFFADRIGPYPYEKLANVQASGFGGGMENATVIFYGEKGVAAGRGPVVHEIAHQWFGNSVTEHDWDHVWLSEGFATYFALLYREHFEGRDSFVEGLRRSRASILQTSRKLPDTPVIHRNLGDMSRVLNGLVYEKGGWVLHMLRREVGTDTFWAGIREYYRRYRDGNASTDDLRQVMEQVSGKSLQTFFEQWLTRGGTPQLSASWQYDPARGEVELSIRQAQTGKPYDLAFDVELATGSSRTRHTVRMNGAVTSVRWPATARPREVVLDPETWLLAEIAVSPR